MLAWSGPIWYVPGRVTTHHFDPFVGEDVVRVAVHMCHRGSGEEQRELTGMVSLPGLRLIGRCLPAALLRESL